MALFLISFVFWAGLHSLTAGSAAKERFRARFGERAYEGWYRLFYNFFSLLSILPVLYALAVAVPQRTLWIIPEPWSFLALALRLVALTGLAVSLWQTDIWSFLGLRQMVRYLRGEPSPAAADQFVSSGTYAWVRHPLYLFSMIFIWANPVMTLSGFLFNVMGTLYFGIGSIYEEKRLEAAFGARYETYKQRVPRFLPWPSRRPAEM
jgi:protein-S-isoprenylcysteine O-methyltransferase Ste14